MNLIQTELRELGFGPAEQKMLFLQLVNQSRE